MRSALTATMGLALLMAACGGRGSTSDTTTGSSGGTTTGATTGGAALAPGAPCPSDRACASGVCGIEGTGNCCAKACSGESASCGATSCDETGACIYPSVGSTCGSTACSQSRCDGAGACVEAADVCPGNFACQPDAGCGVSCDSSVGCAANFVCNAHLCVLLEGTGACTENDDCANGICGIHGTGHCCAVGCISGAPCGAVDCDGDTGACLYPDAGTACGSVAESCSGHTQQNPSGCDAQGACGSDAGTTDCSPYQCGPTACLSGCTDSSNCANGDFCDVASATCCSGLFATGVIHVDSLAGSDSVNCCGLGANRPCQTLAHALASIDAAQTPNVTIIAKVDSLATGVWVSSETYPIVLGWGAELDAPGISFVRSGPNNAEVFDIAAFSPRDTVGSASISGSNANPVLIGVDSFGNPSATLTAVRVEAGSTLYLSNAEVNGSATNHTAAITVAAGASLVLGLDEGQFYPGPVLIGNSLNQSTTDGFDGIVCETANQTGCTITDATLTGSSVVIQGQEGSDIVATDFANISLTSAPVIGIPPAAPGFGECSGKPDVTAGGAAVRLAGLATMTFGNGTMQCLSGEGFDLESSSQGTPTLIVTNTTIQNTETAIYAAAGNATVSGSTIQFNYNGVEQGSDETHVASIDLSGNADAGMNSVVCSSKQESVLLGATAPGVCVLNLGSNPLNASNVDWDTAGPDLYLCMGLSNCSCPASNCTDAPGADGMDAVDESTGTITTTNNGLSTISCVSAAPPPGSDGG